jgi:predicted extracellular nuclease
MRRNILLLLLLAGISVAAGGQQKKYSVAFYNVENLFDTMDDENTYDEEFLPEGTYKWTEERYRTKLERLSEVFYKLASAASGYPVVIGVSEIENRRVLEDLAAMPKMAPARYAIVHFDSPDARGVDVAFFYRPDVLQVTESAAVRVAVPDRPTFRTRDIVRFAAVIDNERFHFFVNHWPSRRGGQQASAPLREAAAATLRHVVDSIRAAEPDAKIVVMGDLNDDPNDRSIEKVLGAKGKWNDVGAGDLFNPMYALWKDGYGTLAYNDTWNVFDNLIVSDNLVNNAPNGYQVYRPRNHKYYAFIFNKPFLTQQDGRYKGYPWRTYAGSNFQGGYSDHFPVYLYIAK